MHYTAMGSLVTMFFVAIVTVPIISGHFSDRFGKKKVMAVAFGAFIFGGLLAAFSHHIAGLYIGIFFYGAGMGMVESIGAAALADSHPEKAEKSINIAESFYSGGAAIGPLAVAAMISAGAGWRILFLVPAILIVILLPLLIKTEFAIREPEGGHILERQPIFSLLKSKLVMLLFICVMVYVGVETAVAYFMDSFFTVELDGRAFSAAVISLYWVSMTLSRILFAVINPKSNIVVKVMFGLAAVLLTMLAFSDHVYAAFFICIAHAFVFGTIWPMLMGVATKRYSASSGTVVGILMMGSGIGGMIFPILMGLVADNANLRWAMLMLVLFCILALVCCFIIFRKKETR